MANNNRNFGVVCWVLRASLSGSDGKEYTYTVGDLGLVPDLGRSPGKGKGYPLQYSCLENPHRQRSLVGCSPWGSQRVKHN